MIKFKIIVNLIIKSLFRQGDGLKHAAKSLILALFYFTRFFYRALKSVFLIKQLPIIIIIIIFLVFTYSEINTIFKNSFDSSLISQLVNKNEKITIETGVVQLSEQEERIIEPDFQIAGFGRDKYNAPEIALSLGGSTLIASVAVLDSPLPLTRTEIEKYIVKPGDTISTIAEKFGLNWSTILWENKLNSWSVIKPGDELGILPVDGITYKVKQGENISSISKKYKSSVEKILEFNNLTENSILLPGNIIIIPDGSPPIPKYKKPEPKFVNENYSTYLGWRRNTQCKTFWIRPGQCTDWVAYKWATDQGQCTPSWGNAKSWRSNAKRDGYEIGSEPRIGAAIAFTCTSWYCKAYGHIAYVEDFDKDTVTFSELNALGSGVYSKRTFKNITNKWQNGWKILGYIYPK